MRARIRKWGNGPAVRIPTSVMAAATLTIGQDVEVRAEDGRIVIEPTVVPAWDLERLVAAMTPETLHDEVDFGPRVGREIW